jgi:hypothetical protein
MEQVLADPPRSKVGARAADTRSSEKIGAARRSLATSSSRKAIFPNMVGRNIRFNLFGRTWQVNLQTGAASGSETLEGLLRFFGGVAACPIPDAAPEMTAICP